MEKISLSPQIYKDHLIMALQARNAQALKVLRNGKDKKRLVMLNTLADLKQYNPDLENDCLILSDLVKDKLDNDWIGSVLSGKPVQPPLNFEPSISEAEIISINKELEARIL